jgi:hypothetical protein
MPPNESIAQRTAELLEHLPQLSRPQAKGLAEWTYGVQTCLSCGQSQVSQFLALVLKQKVERVRQRLREWIWDKKAKKGAEKRRELKVANCFGSLLKWVMAGLPPGERRLVLVLDATTLKQKFVVLAVSVLIEGCAVPVAWQVGRAQAKGAWRPHWLKLLKRVRRQVPDHWRVLVMADRGLFADWLYKEIVKLHWHPFLRINSRGLCRSKGARQFRPLLKFLPKIGQTWRGEVECFQTTQLSATLLAYHDGQHQDPWLILTDLPPTAAQATWYQQRAWIEGGFKDIKSGGWQWQRTRMIHPTRAARLWLVLAVAQLYSLSLGSQRQAATPPAQPQDLPATHIARRTAGAKPPLRRLSLVTLGRLTHLARLILQQPLPPIRFKGPNSCPLIT